MTNKSNIALLLVATLVLALASAGVCFADSWPAYSITQATVSFTSDGFTLTASGADDGYISFQNCSYANASVSWELSEAIASNNKYSFTWPVTDSAITVTFSDVSDSSREGTNRIFFNPNETSGYYNFDISTTDPSWNSGQVRFYVPASRSVTYSFGGFNFNGSTIVSSTVGEYFTFSIPSGYALVIDGACEIIERDYYINNSWNFVGEGTGNRTNGSSERIISRSQIVDGFSPDKNLSRTQLIQWEALNPNLFGTASNYEFSGRDLITVSAGAAFVVSYPLYDGVIPLNGTVRQFENSVNFVGSLYLNYTTRPTIRYVALKSNTQLDNNNVSFYNTFLPTTYDEPASEVVGTDSTVISPPSDAPTGGGNAGEPPLDEEQSIFGFLGRFINRVTNLFNQASEAIHSISGACQSFFAALLGMFSWLPPEWTAVLWGFFLILACVGVVKLFL